MVLIFPLIRLRHVAIWVLTAGYTVFLVLRTVVPVTLNAAVYQYSYQDVFCFELPKTTWSYKFNSVSRVLTLAAPIVPIFISCVCSYVILKINSLKQRKRGAAGGTNATVTILIFTIVYIVFNIPVLVNYLLMSVAGLGQGGCKQDCYYKKFKHNKLLIWFSWNFTYITCVALNSTLNPVIYYFRMKNVKDFVDESVRKHSRVVRDLGQEGRRRLTQYSIGPADGSKTITTTTTYTDLSETQTV